MSLKVKNIYSVSSAQDNTEERRSLVISGLACCSIIGTWNLMVGEKVRQPKVFFIKMQPIFKYSDIMAYKHQCETEQDNYSILGCANCQVKTESHVLNRVTFIQCSSISVELIPCYPDSILIKVNHKSCKPQMKIQGFATQIKL